MRIHLRFLVYLFLVFAFSLAHAGSYEDWFRAVKRDDPKAVAELLKRGFDPNALDPSGRPALFIAVQDGALKVADALIA